MTCKGICLHLKALGRYATGNKRCRICDLFIKWEGVFCPCCGYKLRTMPKSTKSKAKLRRKRTAIKNNKNKNIILSTLS